MVNSAIEFLTVTRSGCPSPAVLGTEPGGSPPRTGTHLAGALATQTFAQGGRIGPFRGRCRRRPTAALPQFERIRGPRRARWPAGEPDGTWQRCEDLNSRTLLLRFANEKWPPKQLLRQIRRVSRRCARTFSSRLRFLHNGNKKWVEGRPRGHVELNDRAGVVGSARPDCAVPKKTHPGRTVS